MKLLLDEVIAGAQAKEGASTRCLKLSKDWLPLLDEAMTSTARHLSICNALEGQYWLQRIWAGGGTAASSGGIPSPHGDPHCSIHGQPPGNKWRLTSTAGYWSQQRGSPPLDNGGGAHIGHGWNYDAQARQLDICWLVDWLIPNWALSTQEPVSDMCMFRKTDGHQTHCSSCFGYTGYGNGIVSCPQWP
jgi:hypothetical protein